MSDIILSVGLADGTEKISVRIPEEDYKTTADDFLGKTVKKMVTSVTLAERQKKKDE
jgi:hypothetical protein